MCIENTTTSQWASSCFLPHSANVPALPLTGQCSGFQPFLAEENFLPIPSYLKPLEIKAELFWAVLSP